MARISLAGLIKRYDGKQVLHGVDVEIEPGQFVVVVGPSGCGKSTLLRMIAGLEDVDQGRIDIDGERVDELDPADRGCAMVFQNYALYPHMTVAENIAYPLKIAGLPKSERVRRVAEAAAVLDLDPYLDRRPAQLSGGQRQRVAMGRAMVREPRVFLFDEPLSNLDAKLRTAMRIEIKRLHRRLGATSIFVTHDQVEAMTMADLLIVMNAGRVEQVGTPTAIYREPASVFVAGFLGAPAMNLVPARLDSETLVFSGGVRLAANIRGAIPVDGPVTVGIRPEDVEVARGPGPHLTARIDLIEELGGTRVAYCRLADQDLAVVLPRDASHREGALLPLRLPADSLHLFEPRTGIRLNTVEVREAAPPLGCGPLMHSWQVTT